MALTPNQIAAGATKFSGLDDRSLRLCITYLLQQWLASLTGTTMTPNQIAGAAKCFQCADDRTLLLDQVYLLGQILANGGGGGGGGGAAAIVGIGNPNGVTSGTTGQFYYASDLAELFIQPSGPSNTGWVQLV